MADEFEHRCPFLGLTDDEDTSISYPSEWNVCHKCHGNPSPKYIIQGELCLTLDHPKCELYSASGLAWMPFDMKNMDGAAKPIDPKAKRRLVVSVFLMALVTLVAATWFLYGPQLNQVVNSITQPTSTITLVPTFTSTPVQATSTPEIVSPTITPYPTLTKFVFTKCGHSLDEEFGTERSFLVHQIKDGETIEKILAPHNVTYDQVLAVNYFVPKPLWVGFPVIIPNAGNAFNDQKSYQALELNETNISIDALSAQLGIQPELFAGLNGLEVGCNSFTGWFIVPRDKVKYYE